jgi:hypothetical protein
MACHKDRTNAKDRIQLLALKTFSFLYHRSLVSALHVCPSTFKWLWFKAGHAATVLLCTCSVRSEFKKFHTFMFNCRPSQSLQFRSHIFQLFQALEPAAGAVLWVGTETGRDIQSAYMHQPQEGDVAHAPALINLPRCGLKTGVPSIMVRAWDPARRLPSPRPPERRDLGFLALAGSSSTSLPASCSWTSLAAWWAGFIGE